MYAQDGQSQSEVSDKKSWCRDSNATNWKIPNDNESEHINAWKPLEQPHAFPGKQTWAQVLNAGRHNDCNSFAPFTKAAAETTSKIKNNLPFNKPLNFSISPVGQSQAFLKHCSNGCSNGLDAFPPKSELLNNENILVGMIKAENNESINEKSHYSEPCSILKSPKCDDLRTSSDPSNDFAVPGPKIITCGGWGDESFEDIKSDLEVGTSVWGDPSAQMQHTVKRWINGNKNRRSLKNNLNGETDEISNNLSCGWNQNSSVKNFIGQTRENKKNSQWSKTMTPGEEWLCEGHVDTSDWGLVTPKTDFDPTEGTIDTSDWDLNTTAKKWENTQWNINKTCDDFGNRNERKQCLENELYSRRTVFSTKEEYVSTNEHSTVKLHSLYRTSVHGASELLPAPSSNRCSSSKNSVVTASLYAPRYTHPSRPSAVLNNRNCSTLVNNSTSNCNQLHHHIMQQYRLAVQAGLLPPDLLDFRLPHHVLKYLQQLFELQQRLQQAVISLNERTKNRNSRFFSQAESNALSKSINCFKINILNLCRVILQAHETLKRQVAQRLHDNVNSTMTADVSDSLVRGFKSLQLDKPKLWSFTPSQVMNKQSQQQVVYSMPVNNNNFRVTSPYWTPSNSTETAIWNDSSIIEHSGVLENHLSTSLCTNENTNENSFGSGYTWPSQNTCVLLRNLEELDYAKLYASSEKYGRIRSLKIFQSHKVALIHYEESQEALNASMFFEKSGLKSAVIAEADVSILERMMIEDTKKGSSFTCDVTQNNSGNSILLPNPVGCERYLTNANNEFQNLPNRSIDYDERNFGTFLIENHIISNCI